MSDRLKAWLDEQLPKGQEAVVYPSDSMKALRALRAVVGWAYKTKHGEAAAQVLRAIEKEVFGD